MKHKTQYISTLASVIFCLLLVSHIPNTKAAASNRNSSIRSMYFFPIGDSAPKPASERAEQLTKSMNCEVGLLGTQVPKVYAINLEACLKMDTVAIQCKDNLALYHTKGKVIDEERNVKLRDVLTEKQFAQYERIASGNKRALKKTYMCRDMSKTW